MSDPIELVLAKQANDAIASGADPEAVTSRLHDMVAHLRSNPDVASQASDALARGADAGAVAGRIYSLAQQGFGGSGSGRTFGDEPTKENFASYGAGSFPFVNKADAMSGALYDKATGNAPGGVMSAYDRRLDAREAGREEYAQAHKGRAIAAAVLANVIPAVATLGTSLAEGAAPTVAEAAATAARGMGSKMLRGAATGAGYGAVQGVSEGRGSPGDYADKIKSNTLLGSLMGAAAPVATAAGGRAVRALGIPQALAAGAEKLGLPNVANALGDRGKASDVIAQRVDADRAAGVVPKAEPKGVPSMPLDQEGPNVQGLAEGIASRPGPGRSTIVGRITERQQQMRPSVQKALAEGTGVQPGAGISPLASELNMLKLKGDQAFNAARKATKGQGVASPSFDEVLDTPTGKAAYRWALSNRPNPTEPLPTGIVTKTDQKAVQSLVDMGVPEEKAIAAASSSAERELPDPEVVHLMKRYLRARARPGAPIEGKDAAEAQNALDLIDKAKQELPPEWREADAIYAKQAKLVDAANRGRRIFDTKINPSVENPRKAVAKSLSRVRRDIAGSSPEEQQATQQSAAGAAHTLLESAPSSVKSPGRIFARSPERVTQMETAFPTPEAAQSFQNIVSNWDAIQEQANRILGNSRTAMRGAENAAAESPSVSVTQTVRHPLRALGSLVKGNETLKQRLAREKVDAATADFLVGNDGRSIPDALEAARLRRLLGDRAPLVAPIALSGGATGRARQ